MGKKKSNIPKSQAVHQEEPDGSQSVDDVGNDIVADSKTVPYEQENSSTSAFLWLLVFSILMFTFPFLTFYGVRSWLQESFDFTTFQTNCFSVLSSVLVVNFIICLYVYKAFREGATKSTETTTRTQQSKKKQ